LYPGEPEQVLVVILSAAHDRVSSVASLTQDDSFLTWQSSHSSQKREGVLTNI
jgi:hypothetical protein